MKQRERLISSKSATPLEIDERSRAQSRLALVATFVVPGLIVTALLFLLVSNRGSIEAGVANLANLLPVGYAFAAGMVASVNPCGILMLPSYILIQLKREQGESSAAVKRALRGLVIALAVTAGFILIFGIVGATITLGGQWLVNSFPYVGLVIGIAMVGLGIWVLVSGRTLVVLGGGRIQVQRQRGLWNAFVFGVAYALGSLSCTLPIFLVVVGTSLAADGLAPSFAQFIGYALGMAAIIFIVTIGAALFRRAMTRWLRLIAPYIHRLGALFLIGAGAYLVYYWFFIAGLA